MYHAPADLSKAFAGRSAGLFVLGEAGKKLIDHFRQAVKLVAVSQLDWPDGPFGFQGFPEGGEPVVRPYFSVPNFSVRFPPGTTKK